MFRVVALVVLLTAGSLADEVWVRTYPPGATVYLLNNELGVTPTQIDFSNAPNNFTIQLVLEGHQTKPVPVDLQRLADTFAEPIRLKPESTGVAIKDFLFHPPGWVWLVLALAAAALAGYLRNRRRGLDTEQRVTTLESYAEDTSRVKSLFSERIADYQLVDALGQGGMATVYRGLPYDNLDPERAVAVKVIASELARQRDFAKRFEREAEICARLDHPNIVRVLSWGEHEGRFYLVMEFVRGQTLGDMLEQDRPAPEQARKVLSDLFGAMVYAHSRGVIHRDLKPDNIMLTEKGLLKVMDFGLAKEEDSEKLTQTGTALGTPAYMAPEQIQGDDLDPRTDQYSLGIIAYEVLAGRLPFDATDVMQLLFAQMTATPPPPSQFHPTLPDEVDAALLKMLAKTAEERFATTEEATHALMVALEGYR